MASTNKSTTDVLQELRELLVGYAKQETVEPLKKLGHYLAWGVGGAVALGLGVYFLTLGTLRGLQRISWTTTGWGSLMPYGVVVVELVVVILLAARAITKVSRRTAKAKAVANATATAKGGRP